MATALTLLWADSSFLPPFESFTFKTFVLPEAMEKLALPSVTTFFFPLDVMTALAVFRTSLPTQLVFALAGQETETGALPFFTFAVCFGIFTPANADPPPPPPPGQMVGLVPETFVAFGVGFAIWTESLLCRCADMPFAGTAPWKEPVPDVLTKLVMQPQVMQLYGVPPNAV